MLGLQLVIAWAGETPTGGVEPRLCWWRSDAIDPMAGGDLFKRLLPRTHAWAGLTVARHSARLTDEKLRGASAQADKMLTLYHHGFELDEALEERLAHHRHTGHSPIDTLSALKWLRDPFDRARLHTGLRRDDAQFKVTPLGRQLKNVSGESPVARAERLAAALLAEPDSKAYPLAHVIET